MNRRFLLLAIGLLVCHLLNAQFLNTNTTSNWNNIWQSGYYESKNAITAPTYGRVNDEWYWGINMAHSGNSANNKYNGQIAIANVNVFDQPTMFYRCTDASGNGKWTKVLNDQGDQYIKGNLYISIPILDKNQESYTGINLINTGINNKEHKWGIYTASYAGAYGISSNGLEIWEYPNNSNNSSSSHRRFVINTTRNDDGFCRAIIIGPKGGLNVGYDYDTPITDTNDLSVNGNVGIGTTNTNGYKLAVNGIVWAKEVIVESEWADYVFNCEYPLMNLADVEKYIKENKHLPGIPSENNVKESGISLGEINKKLLEKIEEQMLYIIELHKQIQKINNTLEQLKGTH